MEINNYLTNKVGDVLTPIKNNETHAIYQVVDATALTSRDIFFIAELEEKADIYGRRLHLAHGASWEAGGWYVEGKEKALATFEKLSPTGQKKETNDSYYSHLIKK